MDFYIDLKNIATEELKNVDLDRVNVNCSPPDFEPQRQYYFMAKCRQIVKSESERLGRPLHACNQVFGCQMNTEPEIMETRINKGFYKRQPQEAAGVFFL